MVNSMKAIEYIGGGWRSSKHARTINGVLGVDVDGVYGFQCKDLVNDYAEQLGAPFTAGNAESLWRVDQNKWVKIPNTEAPKLGDVFVMWYSSGAVEYGHTGIVRNADGDSFVSLDQNWHNSSLEVGSPPAFVEHEIVRTKTQYGIRGYLRLTEGEDMGLIDEEIELTTRIARGKGSTEAERNKWRGKPYVDYARYLYRDKTVKDRVNKANQYDKLKKERDVLKQQLADLTVTNPDDTSLLTNAKDVLSKLTARLGRKG